MDSKLHTEMSVSGEIKNLISASKSSQSVAYRLNIQTNICHTNQNVQDHPWIIAMPPVERVLGKNIMLVASNQIPTLCENTRFGLADRGESRSGSWTVHRDFNIIKLPRPSRF